MCFSAQRRFFFPYSRVTYIRSVGKTGPGLFQGKKSREKRARAWKKEKLSKVKSTFANSHKTQSLTCEQMAELISIDPHLLSGNIFLVLLPEKIEDGEAF
jgi:hypothetical protein